MAVNARLIRICSHERSGTHVLMRSMWDNFYADRDDLGGDAGGLIGEMGSYQGYEVKHVLPYQNLWLTHSLPPPTDVGDLVYVVRDGRDVGLSFARFGRHSHSGTPPPMRGPDREWYRRFFTTWRDHALAYVQTGIYTIRYEDLVLSGAEAIARLADYFELQLLGVKPRTIETPVGWKPSGEIRVGKWRTQMAPELVALFNEIVPASHPGRWDAEVP